MLPQFDPDLVGWLNEKFREIGIEVRTGNTVTAIERSGHAHRVHAQTPNGDSVVEADLVVHARDGEKLAISPIVQISENTEFSAHVLLAIEALLTMSAEGHGRE